MGALGPEYPREKRERRLLDTAIGEDHWKPPALVRRCAFAPTPVAHARLILSAFVAVIPVHVRRAVDAGNQRAAGSRFWFEYIRDTQTSLRTFGGGLWSGVVSCVHVVLWSGSPPLSSRALFLARRGCRVPVCAFTLFIPAKGRGEGVAPYWSLPSLCLSQCHGNGSSRTGERKTSEPEAVPRFLMECPWASLRIFSLSFWQSILR